MAYEPQPVPPYVPHEIQHRDWYCLECEQKQNTRQGIVNHWIVQHGSQGEQPGEGIDIAIGSQLAVMLERRNAWIEYQARRFREEMYDGFTGEDFVAESEIRSA